MEHLLRQLQGWGVEEVLINIHHGMDRLVSFFTASPIEGLRIQFSFEPEILGTGGALRRAAWFLDGQPFWMANADVVAQLDPAPLLDRFEETPTLAALWMHPDRGPKTVELKRSGHIKTFRSPTPGGPGTMTFCGLQLLHPDILNFISEQETFSSIIDAYEAAMRKRRRVIGVAVPDAWWADMGTPEQYLEVHRTWPSRPGKIGAPFTAIGAGAGIHPRAEVHDSVVWEGANVSGRSMLRSAIVATGARVDGPCESMALPAEHSLTEVEWAALDALNMASRRTTAIHLPARASSRSFIRLSRGARRVMLIRYQLDRVENGYHAEQTRFLQELRIRVPDLLFESKPHQFLIVEDVGDRTLPLKEKRYRQTLDLIGQLHRKGRAAARRKRIRLMPGFDARLYAWEHDLFLDQFAARFSFATPALRNRLRRELQSVAEQLLEEPDVLLHRDLQSTNVLFFRKQMVLIDFQGMRTGPAAYDIASLLCDPYISMSRPMQSSLLAYYMDRHPDLMRHEKSFRLAAVQRLAQALGAYGRMSRRPGCERFAAHFRPGLNMMLWMAGDETPAITDFCLRCLPEIPS
ncbi:MAG: phosphotransferase [Verrucomicrobiota bacterium]